MSSVFSKRLKERRKVCEMKTSRWLGLALVIVIIAFMIMGCDGEKKCASTFDNKVLNVRTFPAWENLELPDANLQITDTNYDAPYDPTDPGHNKLISVWGGGVVPKRDNTVPHYNGGLGFADSERQFWNDFSTNPGNVGAAGETIDNKWDIVFEYWIRNAIQF